MKYNKDEKTRNALLGIHKGSYVQFSNLDAETLEKLIDSNFADPEEAQNDAPTIAEFLEFMQDYPEYKAHGYTIGLDRSDYRVSIEGLEGYPKTSGALISFIKIFRMADEFDITAGYVRCWYD